MAMTRMLKYIEDMISHLLTCLLFFTNIPLAHPAGQFKVVAVVMLMISMTYIVDHYIALPVLMTWRMLKMMTVSQCGEESCLETGLQLFGRIRWAACRLWSSWKLRRELERDKTIRAGDGAQLTQDNWIWFDIRQLKTDDQLEVAAYWHSQR